MDNDITIPRDYETRLVKLVRTGAHEANTSTYIRDFLIDVCGWPKAKFDSQALAPRGPIDYQVGVSRHLRALVEVKAVKRPLRREMLTKYLDKMAGSSRHVVGILTNGRRWGVFVTGVEMTKRRIPAVLVLDEGVEGFVPGDVPYFLARAARLLQWNGLARRLMVRLADVGFEHIAVHSESFRAAVEHEFQLNHAGRTTDVQRLLLRALKGEAPRTVDWPAVVAAVRGSHAAAQRAANVVHRVTGLKRSPWTARRWLVNSPDLALPGEGRWAGLLGDEGEERLGRLSMEDW